MTDMLFQSPDMHMHSSFSDGTDTPAELLEKVRRAGIDLFSLTDHDTYAGCEELRRHLRPDDPKFIDGIELSCRGDDGKYHILGYGYNINKIPIRSAVDSAHEARFERVRARLDNLCETGYPFTEEEKREILSLNNPGKPHIAALMIKKGYAKDISEAFELMKGFKSRMRLLTPEQAVDAILKSDGIPVLAHGILADGSALLTYDEIDSRVARLKKAGLMGLECYYSAFTPEQKEIMLSLADKYNLLVTAGSDYHGTTKTVLLGQTNDPAPEKMKRFYTTVRFLLDG